MKINLSKKNYVISAGADGLGFAIANKIIKDNLIIVVTDNKGKTIGYISKKEIDNIQ